MPGPFVHRFEQSLQPFAECDVAIRAAQPAGLLEIGLGETATRAFHLATAAGLLHLLRSPQTEQQIGQGKAGRIINPLLRGASLAQVHLLHLVSDDLGQANLCFLLFTDATQHSSTYIGPTADGVNIISLGSPARWSCR